MSDGKRVGRIEEVIRALGISRNYEGYPCIVHAVDLVVDDPALLRAVTKALYPAVAGYLGVSTVNVERNLRTVVKTCWERGNRPLLDKLAGFPLQCTPTTGEMIDYVAHFIARESPDGM